MYVSHLSLLDFRSYASADVELEPGVNAFVGRNGRGKTNLVEAIGYVATLGSHRVATDAPLIRSGADRAVVRTRIVRGDRASTVELEITQGKANRARINRGQAVRARDVLGVLRTVLFAPEDLSLVKGEPDGRRRFMDQLLVLMMPRVSAVLSDYERVLRQRSALLKSARASRRSSGSPRAESAAAELATLDVWDARLAELGAEILSLRIQLVDALRPAVAAAYEQVSDADGDAEIAYRSSLPALSAGNPPELSTGPGDNFADVGHLRDLLLEALVTARPQELERGVSLVGPHRDDLVLTLGGLPAKGYASHGESWSFALALRLASFRLLGGDPQNSADSPAFWDPDLGTDADPVLILDDVFAELDVRRRQRLADLVLPARQVLVTAAVAEDIPAALEGVRFHVEPGTVTRD
ncbi:DNA replication/repair protein RecF [Promicromonospora iranensis]|uniref:DNA replication and repair protein RecF n=1 Tax=Promicromonospora iranensis TaxID=1105144 RepID=A0ABU2CPN8_9MICO|nr:DNA replication/repair protein RecF [Promicromonospora iranensis]MDR7383300.1 DNA replication and repair protein RecF [Promicromonospora iranensis]